MYQSFSPLLLVLSFIIGIASSYTALTLVERMVEPTRKEKLLWVSIGAYTLAVGIFSVHYVGILAFHVHQSVTFDPMQLIVSFISCLISTVIAFYLLYNRKHNKLTYCLSGSLLGIGMVLAHYIGISAMEGSIEILFSSWYFSASIIIAVGFSIVAVQTFFGSKWNNTKLVSTTILGLTIFSMHSIGMKATLVLPNGNPGMITSFTLAIIVGFATLLLLCIAMVLSFFDYYKLQKERALFLQVKESEERFRRLVELFPESIIVHRKGEILFANQACLNLLKAKDEKEVIGKSVLQFVQAEMKEIIQLRMRQMEEGHRVETMEEKIVALDGTIIDTEVSGIGVNYQNEPACQLVIRDVTEQKNLKSELEDSEQRYRSLFKYSLNPIYSMDRNGKIIDANEATEKMIGYRIEEITSFREVILPEYEAITINKFYKALAGEPQHYETVVVDQMGNNRMLFVTNTPIIVRGEITGVYGLAIDVTKENEARALLEENEEKYRSLFESNFDAVFEVDLNGLCRSMNDMTEVLTGFSKKELLHMPIRNLLTDDVDGFNRTYAQVKAGEPLHVEHSIRTKAGTFIEVDVKAVPVRRKGKVDGVFAVMKDITERNQAQQKIQELAYTDQLTGLSNRNAFYLEQKEIDKEDGGFALLTIDFDNFKGVNDAFGHHTGDQFLKQVSSRLKGIIANSGKLYRIGGDEFVILLQDVTKKDVSRIAKQIIEEMNDPVRLFEHEMLVTLSLGISFTDHFTDVETMMNQADLAMYSAKEKGKNNYQFFTESLKKKVTRKRKIETALRKAIEKEAFQLYYQPQMDIQTGDLVGLEALLRWETPSGFISPAEFIPVAEETGLIVPIGEWVIKEACRQIKEWQQQQLPVVRVSVNVSARQFMDQTFSTNVRAIIEEADLDPALLEIEITESVMLDVEQSTQLIQELKELGVKIAIDDFGAGYSSLNIIKNVPVDTLKIDKSLVDDIRKNERMESFLLAVINVGKQLNTQVVVEGIETEEQVEFLRPHQVIGQGYYFARPFPPEMYKGKLNE